MSTYEHLQDDEVYPIEASLWGTNAYHFSCNIRSGIQANCICTNKLKAFDENRRAGILEECVKAIGGNECPARAMRLEEELAGKAIYFVNRKKLQTANDARDAASKALTPAKWGEKPKTSYSTPAKSPAIGDTQHRPAVAPPEFAKGGYADAINRAMEALPPSPEPKPSAPVSTVNVAKAGMSMVEIARAALARASV